MTWAIGPMSLIAGSAGSVGSRSIGSGASDDPRERRSVGRVVGGTRGRAQVAIKEDVAAHPEDAIARPPAVGKRHAPRDTNGRTAVADDERRDGDLQAIQ